MNKALSILIIVILLLGVGYWYWQNSQSQPQSGNQPNQEEVSTPQPPESTEEAQTPVSENPVAVFEVAEYGSFEVTLDGQAAPKTVENFVKLVNDGFYNGLTFHRIVQTFMIQGGDPKGDGTGGPGYTIPAEIGLKHTKGAIAMARLGDEVNPNKDSSGSQFYITLAAQSFLDGQYTVFGYVTAGQSVVDKIGLAPTEPNPFTGEQSVPIQDVVITKITIND